MSFGDVYHWPLSPTTLSNLASFWPSLTAALAKKRCILWKSLPHGGKQGLAMLVVAFLFETEKLHATGPC